MFDVFEITKASDILGDEPRQKGAILSVDIGTVYTRAALFDIVDGSYNFIAQGTAATTTEEPWRNILIGLRQALDEISNATGRKLFNSEDEMIIPETGPTTGINTFIATASTGKPIKAILVGMMPGVSMVSGERLADSSYLEIVDTLDLSTDRRQDIRLDTLLQTSSDILIFVGGSDGGARASILKQLDTIGLACSMMEPGERPTVLYAGNSALRDEAVERIQTNGGANVILAKNVRPTIDQENLKDAQEKLVSIFHSQKSRLVPGFAAIGRWTEEGIIPTAYGFGQCVLMLGAVNNEDVLGIDIGSSSTTISTMINGKHNLSVSGSLGIGQSLSRSIEGISPQQIQRWLTFTPDSTDEIMNIIMNRTIYHDSIPTTRKEIEVYFALVREILKKAIQEAKDGWPPGFRSSKFPQFDTILLSGSTLTSPPDIGFTFLSILDALQPTGSTRILLDPYKAAPAIGLLAESLPLTAIQLSESDALVDIGEIIAISGEPIPFIDRISISTSTGRKSQQQRLVTGTNQLHRLNLLPGENYAMTVRANRRILSGSRSRRTVKFHIGPTGKIFIIDTRGRPIHYPRDMEKNRKKQTEWMEILFKGGTDD